MHPDDELRGSGWLRPAHAAAGPRLIRVVRWSVAGASFVAVVLMFLFMDFGNRGHHFTPDRAYASNVAPADAPPAYDLTRLRLLTRCVGYIRANYVDPTRADARNMIVSALDDVEKRVPELISDPIGEPGRVTQVRVRVGEAEQVFDLERVTDLYTMNWKLLDVFEFITPNLSASVDRHEVEYAAVNGMLRTLDPHSVLLTPHVYREMKLGTTGKFGGLGIVIGQTDGQLAIQSVIDGTPADEAGLRSGDRIVQIGGESTVNMTLEDAVKRLRGAPGTPVTIWIQRKGLPEPKKYRIIRSNITLASVTSKLLEDGVGYVQVKNFQESTSDDLRTNVERLDADRRQKSGGKGLRGLVLDLRDNPGGLLDQAIAVSDLFLNEGTIVTTVGSGNKVREEKIATDEGTWRELPLVVLVNSGSASASEIVAGALRNNDRGVIVGSRTFGKGSVQVIYDIDDSALKLTIAQYLTPGDESIQSVGITPHVELRPVVVAKDHIDLATERHSGGERSLENHLDNGTRVKPHEPDAHVAFLHDEGSGDKKPKGENDFALRLAAKMILEAGRPSARELLNRARPIFALAAREQSGRIVEALGKLDVDWNEGANPRKAVLRAKLEASDQARVTAGKKVTLTLKVTNKGSTPVSQLRARLTSPIELFDGYDLVLGRVPPGETRDASVSIEVPRGAVSQLAPLTATLYYGKAVVPAEGADVALESVEVQGLPRPRFAYSVQVRDPLGNGDGVLNSGEHVNLLVRLTNVGTGAAQKTLATLKNAGGEEVFITDGRAWLDKLAPGETRDVTFAIESRGELPQNGPALRLEVTDTVLRQRMDDRLAIPSRIDAGPKVAEVHHRWVSGEEPSPVRSGASETAGVLATLPARSGVHTDAETDRWLRVPLTGGQSGWIAREGLAPAAEPLSVPQEATLPLPPQIAQPDVDLGRGVPLETTDATIRIAGDALFAAGADAKRGEVFIFRGDAKVFFSRAAAGASGNLAFDASVALEPGLNRIAVSARAGSDLVFKKSLVVYRKR